MLAQALQVLDVEFRSGVGDHVLVRRLHRGIREMRSLDIVRRGQDRMSICVEPMTIVI